MNIDYIYAGANSGLVDIFLNYNDVEALCTSFKLMDAF